MPCLYLNEDEMTSLVDMPAAIEAVRGAFAALADGKAENVPRRRASAPGVVLHSMSAAAEYLGLVGWKCYTTTRTGALFHLGLYDAASGELVALVEADRLGQLRTGATTGVAVEWMADMSATEMGLFGAGRQAETQLEAVAHVRQLKSAYVYSRNPARRADFAARMAERTGVEVIAVDRPQEAAEDLPIVVTATTGVDQVLAGDLLTITVTVTNNGPSDAQNVSASLPVPVGALFVSATASAGGACTGPAPGASSGTMNSGDSILVVKSRNSSRSMGLCASGSRPGWHVLPRNNSGNPDSAFRRCCPTCPGVQLPAKGTRFNCSCEKRPRASRSSVVDWLKSDINAWVVMSVDFVRQM